MQLLLFYAFAAVAVVASLLVIGQRNPMYSVLLLIVSFGALSGLYLLLEAPFVAVIQIIIYAGAIMVVFLFVVMLLNAPREEALPADASRAGASAWRAGAVLAVILAAELLVALGSLGAEAGREGAIAETPVRQIGQVLFTEYGLAVQATAVLTLVAMIGAIVIAGRRQ